MNAQQQAERQRWTKEHLERARKDLDDMRESEQQSIGQVAVEKRPGPLRKLKDLLYYIYTE